MLFQELPAKGWANRRAQRCLAFAVIFALIFVFGLYERHALPRRTELQVQGKFRGVYTYMSKPEHGMPRLPFRDNPLRKSTEQPFFEWPEENA